MVANTYWSREGKYEDYAKQLQAMVPRQGELDDTNPVELFRVAVNVYHDIYNNGLGNAHIRVPPFLEKMSRALEENVFDESDVDLAELKSSFDTLRETYETYQEEEEEWEASSPWGDDEDYCGDPPIIDSDNCEQPMEIIMDAIILSCARRLGLKPTDLGVSPTPSP